MDRKFDAIVVGAGPAGCACAAGLAKAGLETLVIERGKFAGAKNMWGGAFYGPAMDDLFPKFREEAPVERHITHKKISLMNESDCFTFDYTSGRYKGPPYHGFTLLRSRFDRWLAKKVEEAGAVLAVGLKADDLLIEGDRVTGVKAGGDDMPADVVVACDGVNSILAQRAGLRGELRRQDVKLGVKEVIELPREKLEGRFGLSGDEGVAWEFIGCTGGLPGGAFIYTNRDSLSVGVVVNLGGLGERGVRADDLLEDFKKHPAVSGLLEGGKLIEYSAHLIPAAGTRMLPRLYRDGFLVAGDAAALVLVTGLVLEGANYAVASGLAAAETIIRAKEKKDFSAETLAYYQQQLEQSFVLRDLETYRKAPDFLENPRIYTTYPDLACDLAGKMFTSDGKPRKKTWKVLRETMKDRVSLWRMFRDFSKGKGAL